MRTPAQIAALLVAGVVAAAVSGAREATVKGGSGGDAIVRLDARDNGRRVELPVGGRLTVALRANPSTGYSWRVVSSGEPVIRQVGEPAFAEDSAMAGAGGTLTLVFRAEEPGTAPLRLAYTRPWEKDKAPADTFAVTVVVTK